MSAYKGKKLAELRKMATDRGIENANRLNKGDLIDRLELLDAQASDPADFGDLPDKVEKAPDEAPKPAEEDDYKPPTDPPSEPPRAKPVEKLGPEPDPPQAFELMSDTKVVRVGMPVFLKKGRILWNHLDDLDSIKASGGVIRPRPDLQQPGD